MPSPPSSSSLGEEEYAHSHSVNYEDSHDYNGARQHRGGVSVSLVAGGCAGAIAKTITAPLDRTKIMFQTTNRIFSYRAAASEFAGMVRNDGALSLWRGHSATLARVVPYAALQFVAFDGYKRALISRDARREMVLNPLERLAAGSAAGATAVLFTYPLDLVRARMAVNVGFRTTTGHMRATISSLVADKGPMALYQGLSPTLLGILPYAGLSFGTFETLKVALIRRTAPDGRVARGQENALSIPERLACGAISGLVAQTATYPLDTVRRRMQTEGAVGVDYRSGSSAPRRFTSMAATARAIVLSEGAAALFKGVSMNWVKGPVAVSISFTSFDTIKRLLESS